MAYKTESDVYNCIESIARYEQLFSSNSVRKRTECSGEERGGKIEDKIHENYCRKSISEIHATKQQKLV